ncbi:MAG: hypothetical protein JSU95_19510 [Betaproteobacteria bacterium]|nr:MAG: hypothetical protein JSU95_19510 [Betaproteobacteria bacterium]
MSSMADQGDNKDALLEKLDGLMQSGRARKRRDTPPVLTDAIPTARQGNIPTLTDVVELPDTSPTEQPAEQAEEQEEQPRADVSVDLDTPLEFESAMSADSQQAATSEPSEDTPVEPDTTIDHQQEGTDDAEPNTAAELQDSISARLVSVVDREMSALSEQIPAHKNKLAVLQRSLRFALPELVRLRLQEDRTGNSDDDSDDPADADS